MLRRTIFTALLLASTPALADDRDFCPNRPGLNTPACTLAPGDVMIEVGLGEWDHSSDAATIDDTLVLGNTTLRLGLTDRTEAFVGFTTYVHDRTKDRAAGNVTTVSSTGDVTLGLRRGIAGPNGPIAVQPFVTLPVGKPPGGAGDWGAGLAVPMGFDLGAGFQLALSPEVDAAVNGSGTGRHFAFGSAAGLSHPLGPKLMLSLEAALMRDEDPAGHETQATGAVSLAWQVSPTFQFDVEFDRRIAGGEPDHALLVGLAKRIG